MPRFTYQALTQESKPISGSLTAADRTHAIALLAEAGRFVTTMSQADGNAGGVGTEGSTVKPALPWGAGMSGRAKATLFRQLSVALQAGLDLLATLKVVGEQAESPSASELIEGIAGEVESGESLSDAMAAHTRTFTPLEVAMVRVGEAAGVLDQVMASLTEFAERDLEVREKLRGAAIYPLMVMGLGVVSIIVVLTFILPRITAVIGESGQTLPLPTQILMAISDALRSPAGVIGALLLIGGVGWLWWWTGKPAGRLARDGVVLRLPVLGEAVRRVAMARFARTLGTLSRAGVPIVESMRIIRNTLGNEVLAQQVDGVAAGLVQGRSIAEPLRETGWFPPLLIQVIAMGEKTGKLDELLLNAADAYDRETAASLQRVMTVVPVLFILVLAIVVAFILAAALLPVMTMDFAAGA
ncbi:MAG: type II secretion system F family protein [Planctomycetota bacterium]